jgi:predicted deacetylase
MQRPDAVAIAVHDVSPATWRECRELLAMLDDAGAPPVTLLVVPHFHHAADVLRDPAFIGAIDARRARGDELVLHGYYHVHDAAPPRTPRGWLERRVLTRAEGEFAALDEAGARGRLARGIEMFRTLGWPLYGFVPPAWLMGPAARAALAQCGHAFDYVTVRSGIYDLPQWRFERTANLCYSPDTAPRRALSTLLIGRELRRARTAPLLRISLHPRDAREPRVLDHWKRLVADALAQRTAMTKHAWVMQLRRQRASSQPQSDDVATSADVRAASRQAAEPSPPA